MHLSLLFWCVVLSFTKAQQDRSGSTSASTNSAIPWITYTSTRSCTAQPSTVFVYTSNSRTFLLPQPGPNSAITAVDSGQTPSHSDPFSGPSDGGLSAGSEDPLHVPSGITASITGPVTTASTTHDNEGFATPDPILSQPVQDSSDATVVTGGQHDPSSFNTPNSGPGPGFSAGNGPRSGIQAVTSSVFTMASAGSTCPLPSTVTVSAVLPDGACTTMAGKTVTSYIMASCPVSGGGLEYTQTVVRSGRTAYITRTRQMTRPVVITYTTIERGTTMYRTSLQEQPIAPSSSSDAVVDTTLEDGTTVDRSSLTERTAAQSVPLASDEVGPDYCTSMIERTITIERTLERTVPSSISMAMPTITLTLGSNGRTTYPMVESGSTPYHTSAIRESFGQSAIVFTTWEGGSTIYKTSIISAIPSSMTVTYTSLQEGSTIYRTSVVERTQEAATVTYTDYQEASTLYSISIVQQTPVPITMTYSEVLGGSTIYSISTIFSTPEPGFVTFTTSRDGSTIYEISTIESTPEPKTITFTDIQGGSTIYSTSVFTTIPDPSTVTFTQLQEENVVYRTSIIEKSPEAMTITYTDVQPASTVYNFSVVERTPEPITMTYTTIEGGSIVYSTAYIDQTPIPEIVTQTLTEDGQTVYRTSLVERTIDSEAAVEPTPASASSLPVSTVYSCTAGIENLSSPANASVTTITSTMFETLNASECAASLGASTVTSFIYGSDTSSFMASVAVSPDLITVTFTEAQDGSTVYRTSVIEHTVTASTFLGGSALATQTVTSFIYGQTATASSSDELMTFSTTFYEISTVTETSIGNCSLGSSDALSVQTVTSIVYPSSCDYRYTTRDAPEITVTRRGSTVTVYASRTRTIVAYSTIITTATSPGNASQTEESEPSPDPDEDPSDEDFPEDEPVGTYSSTNADATSTYSIEGPPSSSIQPQVSPSPVVANATDLAQQGTASDPYVVAQVVSPEDMPPITPPTSNSSFLLVTFGSTNASSASAASSTGGLRKRQASQQPLTYNATTYFSSVAGGIYNLSASAAMAQNGDTPPSCALNICVGTTCSSLYQLSATFTTYTYTYSSPNTVSSQAGVFSIQCVGQAYVGLDNVRVDPVFVPQTSPSLSPTSAAGVTSSNAVVSTDASSAARTSSFIRASVRTVTTSILSVITTTAYATQTLTQTESTQILGTLNSRQVEPTTVLTTQYETATSLQNVTVSDVQTLTSKYPLLRRAT